MRGLRNRGCAGTAAGCRTEGLENGRTFRPGPDRDRRWVRSAWSAGAMKGHAGDPGEAGDLALSAPLPSRRARAAYVEARGRDTARGMPETSSRRGSPPLRQRRAADANAGPSRVHGSARPRHLLSWMSGEWQPRARSRADARRAGAGPRPAHGPGRARDMCCARADRARRRADGKEVLDGSGANDGVCSWWGTAAWTGSSTAPTNLLHKSAHGRGFPFSGQTHPTVSVAGVPSAVKPFSTATRTWNSATSFPPELWSANL